jgi:hypothetical protein
VTTTSDASADAYRYPVRLAHRIDPIPGPNVPLVHVMHRTCDLGREPAGYGRVVHQARIGREPSPSWRRRAAMDRPAHPTAPASVRLPSSLAVRLAVLGLLAAAIAAVAGCGLGGAAASGPLVTVETRGGECVDGPCGMTVVLERDGSVHSADKPPNDLGTVPAEQVAAIDAAIKLTNFPALRNRPFTGECPTAFDGQEIVFEFSTPSGPERLASCESDLDYGLPLFVAVSAALAEWVPLPVT